MSYLLKGKLLTSRVKISIPKHDFFIEIMPGVPFLVLSQERSKRFTEYFYLDVLCQEERYTFTIHERNVEGCLEVIEDGAYRPIGAGEMVNRGT